MATLQQVEPLRRATDDAVALAQADLRSMLLDLDTTDLDRARRGLEAGVDDIVYAYGFALASVSADWYDEARDAARAPGRYVATPTVNVERAAVSAFVGWSLQPLYSDTPDVEAAYRRLASTTQKQVADVARGTIVDNTRRDPARPRYYRGASANCCAWCAMLAARGPVYGTESAAEAGSHRDCRCFPVALWPGERLVQPEYYADFVAEYEAAAKAARAAGEPVVAPSPQQRDNRRDTVLWRMRRATGRK